MKQEPRRRNRCWYESAATSHHYNHQEFDFHEVLFKLNKFYPLSLLSTSLIQQWLIVHQYTPTSLYINLVKSNLLANKRIPFQKKNHMYQRNLFRTHVI
jgi:hypothetical protein